MYDRAVRLHPTGLVQRQDETGSLKLLTAASLGLEDEPGALEASTLHAYSCVPFVYRAVDLRAKAVAGMPWALYQDDERVTDEARYAPLLREMRQRLYQTEAALCLYGASYWLKERNRLGEYIRLRWVVPGSVLPRYDGRRGLLGYERTTTAGTHTLGVDDVIAIWQPGLQNEVGPGLAPARVALSAAGVLRQLDLFSEGFFRRGAVKATLLSVEGNPSKAELERLETWWRRLVSGVRRAWESVAIRSTVKPIVVGEGLEALTDETLTDQRRQDVCAALGVPHSMLASNASTRAVAERDTLNFYNTTVVPACELISEALNSQIFGALGLRFAFEPQRLEVYQASEVEKARSLVPLVRAEIMTIDEARALLDLPKAQPTQPTSDTP